MNQVLWDLYQHHPWVLLLLFVFTLLCVVEAISSSIKKKVIYRTIRKCSECPHCNEPPPQRRIRI